MSIALQAPQPEFRVGKTATVKKAKKGFGEAWNFRELDPHIVCGSPVPSLSPTGIAENPPESAKNHSSWAKHQLQPFFSFSLQYHKPPSRF